MSTTQKSVLRPSGTATIPASETAFDPQTTIMTRSGLYVYESFIDRVRKHAQTVKSMEALAFPYFDLTEDALDSQIEASLGDQYEFSETEVCYVIDRLITRQKNGEDGALLTNEHPNFFYITGGPLVSVLCDADHQKWYVNVWHRDVYRVARVFSHT